MKAKVRLTHTVEMFVDGKSKEEIQEWLTNTTPNEAKSFAEKNGKWVEEDYSEEIICSVRDDSYVDYKIE